MKKYVLPEGGSPGTVREKDLENLHRKGPSRNNSEIVVFHRGKRIARIPYSDRLKRRLGAEIPPVEISKRERGEITREVLEEREREKPLYWGELPAKQAVRWKSQEIRGIGVDELKDWLVDDLAKDEKHRWFWRIKKDTDEIETIIEEMREDNQIFVGNGEVYPGVELELGRKSPYDIKPGLYPPIKLMKKLAEEKGRAALSTFADKVRGNGWASSRAAVENMAERADRLGILNKNENNTYEIG